MSSKSPVKGPDGVYATLKDLIRLEGQATGFSFLPRQPIHSLLAGRHASRLRGRGLNFEEIRRYLPGDDVRNIDWKVTNRLKKPHVRVFTEERDRSVLLLVDQRMSMFFGSRRQLKSVTAAEAAGLSAWRVFNAKDRPGAVVFDDRELRYVSAQRSRANVMQIFGAVVDFNQRLKVDLGIQPNPGMLNQVLRKARQIATHDWLVVVISDFGGADEETTRLLTQLGRRNDVISLFVYDKLEQSLPDVGRLVASDAQLQVEVQSRNPKLRERHHAMFQDRFDHSARNLKKHGIPVLPIEGTPSVAEQIRRLIGHSIPSA
jgi:uncharacterized protein (DUF58 family)